MVLDYSFWASIVTPALATRTTPHRLDPIADREPTGESATAAEARSIKPRAR